MALTAFVDLDRDRPFFEGETIYDVDGNAYTVRSQRAELCLNDLIFYDLADESMRRCFSRINPRPRETDQTQSCQRGEHMYETGRRFCRLCGADL